jgi:hypothetical protein
MDAEKKLILKYAMLSSLAYRNGTMHWCDGTTIFKPDWDSSFEAALKSQNTSYTPVQKAQWLVASVSNARMCWARRQELRCTSIDAS